MELTEESRTLIRHETIVAIVAYACVSVLIIFRGLLELGLASGGANTVFKLPLDYWFLTWFFALIALRLSTRRSTLQFKQRVAAIEWALGVLGIAVLMWMASFMGWRLLTSHWRFAFASAGIVLTFLSASFASRMKAIDISRHLLSDFLQIVGRPTTWACSFAALAMIAFGPRSGEIPTRPQSFKRWYERQERLAIPPLWQPKPVTLVELIDYQCPACRQADRELRDTIAEAVKIHPSTFQFVTVDFPLESECNSDRFLGQEGGPHRAACEAAAGVRLARAQSAECERSVIDWLWAHQSNLTRDIVFNELEKQFNLPVRKRYAELLPAIVAEAAVGRSLNPDGTPEFFLNGRRLPPLPSASLQAAIEIEIQSLPSPKGAGQ